MTLARTAITSLLLSLPLALRGAEAPPLPANHGKVDARLFLGDGPRQPLIVGFGGAEGDNLFAKPYMKAGVDGFLKQGYAFLAIGYFAAPGAPKELDRIALEGVHAAIAAAARDPKVNKDCIAVLGGSIGGELSLLLASHYPDIKAVVGLVPGSAVFPAHTSAMDTASFSLNGKALPFVPLTESAVPYLRKRELRPAWDEMMKNEAAVEAASIAVEKINGPILLISATQDELWPSQEMSERVVKRLAAHRFPFDVRHVAVEGKHDAGYTRPELSDAFLKANLLDQSAAGCPRRRS
jgi:pimeloyl-ACP methyl ester carboxylesterase